MTRQIFVFGSNIAGKHGAGAALSALKYHEAIYGLGEGLQGNSYAIPTKDDNIETLPLDRIKEYVNVFLDHANQNSDNEYIVTRIGCGLAGLADSDMAIMFSNAPSNCLFDKAWKEFLPTHNFWGSY